MTERLHFYFMIHTKGRVTKSSLALLTAQEISKSRDKEYDFIQKVS